MNVCVGEYNGTDKETETKPDVVFLGVSLESRLGFFLVAELSCLSKASWELSSSPSSRRNQVVITQRGGKTEPEMNQKHSSGKTFVLKPAMNNLEQ